jgi:hypothetical protein
MAKTLAATILIAFPALSAAEPPNAVGIRSALLHAEADLRIGLAEAGDLRVFRRGLARLDAAEQRLVAARPGEPSGLPNEDLHRLRLALSNQEAIARTKFFGVFPLARLVGLSPFLHEEATGNFELYRDPAALAVRRAIAPTALASWKLPEQFDSVLTSLPRDVRLENEAQASLAGALSVFVRSHAEVARALSPPDLAAFEAGEVTLSARAALARAFGSSRLMVVTLRRVDVVDGDWLYRADGRIYGPNQEMPGQSFSSFGLARDRRGAWPSLVAAHGLLLALAVALHVWLWRPQPGRSRFSGHVAAAALVAFVVGAAVTWLLMPTLASLKPDGSAPAALAWWWPSLTGAGLLLGPALLYRIARPRLGALGPLLGIEGSTAPLLAGAALGACACLSVPLFLFLENRAWTLLLPVSLAGAAGAYLMGRCIGPIDPLPLRDTAVPVVAGIALGPAVFSLSLPATLTVSSVTLAAVLAVLWAEPAASALRATVGPEVLPEAIGGPRTLGELVEALAGAGRVDLNDEVLTRCRPLKDEDRTVWIGVAGPAGSGKSATVSAILGHWAAGPGGAGLIPLTGRCPRELGGTSSGFTPFREAFRAVRVNPFGTTGEGLPAALYGALEGLLETVVPLAGLLGPKAAAAPSVARDEHFR